MVREGRQLLHTHWVNGVCTGCLPLGEWCAEEECLCGGVNVVRRKTEHCARRQRGVACQVPILCDALPSAVRHSLLHPSPVSLINYCVHVCHVTCVCVCVCVCVCLCVCAIALLSHTAMARVSVQTDTHSYVHISVYRQTYTHVYRCKHSDS